jgi:ASC-1-like (ASCH) protein
MNYNKKYLKYKYKYLNLIINQQLQFGGTKKLKNSNDNKNSDKLIMENYIENLSEPWFSLISLGLKTIEGRKNKGRFKDMKVGEIIKWTNNDFKERSILTEIIKKTEYKTFQEYLEFEGLHNCLPGIPDMETGLSIYYKYFTKEDESEFGVVAFEIKLLL